MMKPIEILIPSSIVFSNNQILKDEIEEIENMLSEGSGFGNPDARKNVELKLQTLLSKQQLRTANQLIIISWILAIAALLNVLFVAIQTF